jgi:hypothetical protein
MMLGKNPRATNSRIRRARVDCLAAELDLVTRSISISRDRPGKAPLLLEEGNWNPLPEPMGDLRGSISVASIHRRTRAMFEYRLGRGDRTWSYDHGPWITAEKAATAAGVDIPQAELIRKLLWLFYRNRWPLQFSAGCGWGSDGYGPLIVAALADPARARARAELLILTGGLQWPAGDGSLHEVAGDALADDFYASP